MSDMVDLLERFDLPEGITDGPMDGIIMFKSSEAFPKKPQLYQAGICVLAQGSKSGYLGDHRFEYDAQHYLVTSMLLPLICETRPDPGKPLLGFSVKTDMGMLNELINQIGERHFEEAPKYPVGPAPFDPGFHEASIKLLQCLHSEMETRVLGEQRVRELFYHALLGPQAPALYALFNRGSHFSKIARILGSLHENFAEKLVIDDLAAKANMSPSTFHRAFREVTSDTPIQYLKKLRLEKARELMTRESVTVYMAADHVGYESVSQFSREFKRYFGQSPSQMANDRITA